MNLFKFCPLFLGNIKVSRIRFRYWLLSLLMLFLLVISGCKPDSTDDPDSLPGYPLAGTEWESSGSRLLKFIDNNIATYRNSGNSYVLSYTQTANDVVFTISGNTSPDWTGFVNATGSEFTLNKDEYIVVFNRISN